MVISIEIFIFLMTTPLMLYYTGYISEKLLPIKMWLPTNVTDTSYWFYYSLQAIHIIYAFVFSYAHDILFFSLSFYAAHQFNILYYRLKKLMNDISIIDNKQSIFYAEQKLISNISEHYQMIYL